VTPASFKLTLSRRAPPNGLTAALRALWWAKKGNWERAHDLIVNDADGDGAWVHAYLHRLDGDRDNARYWYRQARRRGASGSLDAEWDAIVAALLEAQH